MPSRHALALAASIADLSRRRLEIERSLLALGRSTELDVESKRLDVMTKTADLWRARADLLLTQLSLASAIGEDLAMLIEGPSQ